MLYSRFGGITNFKNVEVPYKLHDIWVLKINKINWAMQKDIAIYFLECNNLNHLI